MTLTFALVITRLSTVFNRDKNAFHRFYSYNLIVSIIFLPDSLAVYFLLLLLLSRSVSCLVVLSQNMNFYRSMVLFGHALLSQISAIGFICVFFGSRNNSISNRPTGKYMENLQPLNYWIKHGKINRTHNFIFTTL